MREAWLHEAATHFIAYLDSLGISCPPVRVSCGFPSEARAIGQCFDGVVCADGIPQIFISPVLGESIEVLSTLLHELLHAAIGCECGHGRLFSQAARTVGLVGKPTATTAGEALRQRLEAYVQRNGPYPHAALLQGGSRIGEQHKRKSGSRLRLFECACTPPIKVRVARDDLPVLCLTCNHPFHQVVR
ncbi:hypothetical protein KSF_108790 [Reticulibacter mediterranei]|uniref:SprT-like domain-containing protein n=1 Tax=Reticulibacter mediterranei TaxID=2778369 RepID=A0A8J3J3E8_9CHLR|nr:hypothetical protein KSF_108790 [Reticulibacter mediterranei]